MSAPVPREAGFTLVELLVALLIFGMLSSAGVALLSFSVRSQEAADLRLDQLAQIRRAGALMAADFAQATPRPVRDRKGVRQPAFRSSEGSDFALALVRRGWENFSGASRPSLQKVEYAVEDGRLVRRAYPFLDGAVPLDAGVLIEDVRQIRLRYRDEEGEWRDVWDPRQPTLLPRAVEVVLATGHSGTVRQLFLTGAQG